MVLFNEWSISRKVSVAVVVAVAAGYSLLVELQATAMRDSLYDSERRNTLIIANLLATNIQGGVRWRKPASIERAYSAFVDGERSSISNLSVYDSQHRVLTSSRNERFPQFELSTLIDSHFGGLGGQSAIHIDSRDHIVALAPVVEGKESLRVGTLAIAYSKERIRADIAGRVVAQSGLAVGILVLLVALLVILLRLIVTRRVNEAVVAMTSIAGSQGNLDHRLDDRGSDEMSQLAASFNLFMDKVERAHLMQDMQFGVTRILAESETLSDAIPSIIKTICETFGWDCGIRWSWRDQAQVLRCAESWSTDSDRVAAFVEQTRAFAMEAGSQEGLVRRVWNSGEPHWISDISKERGFRRVNLVLKAELHGAFAIPILGHRKAIGVMEFYSRQVREPDENVLEILRAVGRQVGQFIERKRAEAARVRSDQALAQKSTQLELTLENMDQGVSMYDAHLNMIACNRRFQELLDLPPGRFGPGTSYEALIRFAADSSELGSDDAEEWIRTRLLSAERNESTRIEHTRPDGRVIEVRGDPIPGGGFIRTYTDISEHRQVEKQLRRAKEVSEETARSKGEFLANMSHEIRTPMNGVLGLTELLLQAELPAQQHRVAQSIRRSGETLLNIINNVLDFSKMEAGKLVLESAEFDLRELAEDVVELHSQNAAQKGLELLCSLPADVPCSLRGDPTRLRQILTNLIGNAIKFTERGEVVLRAGMVERAHNEVLLRLEVSDTGIGIPRAAQSRVFESFSQADGSTTRKHGGTGLGLAIARQLVELMGGEIGMQSEPNAGSTFWFQTRFTTNRSANPNVHAADLSGLRVLVVDDNATNREVLANQLAPCEADHASAASAREALQRLRAAAADGRPFDVAMVDMHMPGMDGIELVRAIQAEQAIACVRRVMLSSVSDQLDADRISELGIEAYLTKPVRQSELLRLLAQMHGHRAPDPRASSEEREPAPRARFEGKILVVEDNLANQEVVVGLLGTSGCRIDVTENGREAVAAWAEDHYDLVLMDCQMPMMDGFEATREIRRREREHNRRPVPIVALTANAFRQDRERCLGAGMDDYLSKPFTLEALLAVLRRWLPGTGTAAGAPAQAGSCERDAPGLEAEPSQGEKPALLDVSALESLREMERNGRTKVVARVIGAYVKQTPKLIDQLRAAVASDDASGIQFAAHTLKSSSASVGAVALSALCKDLEDLGRKQSTEGAAERFVELEAMSAEVIAALAKECREEAA